MGLFRCAHYIKMEDMKNISTEKSDMLGKDLFIGEKGIRVKYTGHCSRCNAFVRMEEDVINRALYVHESKKLLRKNK